MPDAPAADSSVSPSLLARHKGKVAAGGGLATLAAILVPLIECWQSAQTAKSQAEANKAAIRQTEIHYVTVEDWNAGRKSDLEQVERLIRMASARTNQ